MSRRMMYSLSNDWNILTGLVISGDYTVSSGTRLVSTLLDGKDSNNKATVWVNNGGMMVSTTMSGSAMSYDNLIVRQGGYVIDTDVYVGSITLYGSAENTLLTNNASMYVSNGGVANNVKIQSGGRMLVGSNGSASRVDYTPFVGYCYHNCNIDFVNPLSGVYYGSANTLISQTQQINSITLAKSATLYVFDSGIVSSASVTSYGENVYVYSGGVVSSYNAQYAGDNIYVYNGGYVESVNCHPGGCELYSGCTVNNIVMSGHANNGLVINSGVVCENPTLISSANCAVRENGILKNTSLTNMNSANILSGGTMCSSYIGSGAHLDVTSGGYIEDITFSSGGCLAGCIFDSETHITGSEFYFQNVTVSGTIYQNMLVNNAVVNSGGRLSLNGGTVLNATISSGGILFYAGNNGGIGENINMMSGANCSTIWVSSSIPGYVNINYWDGRSGYISGGVASGLCISKGYTYIYSGSQLLDTEFVSGSANIFRGAHASNITAENLRLNCTASDVYFDNITSGYTYVSSGGVLSANNMTKGFTYVTSGGVLSANNMTSNTVYIYTGGVVSANINPGINIYVLGGTLYAHKNTTTGTYSIRVSSGGQVYYT